MGWREQGTRVQGIREGVLGLVESFDWVKDFPMSGALCPRRPLGQPVVRRAIWALRKCSGVGGATCGVGGLCVSGASRAGAIILASVTLVTGAVTLAPVTLVTVAWAVRVPVVIGTTVIPLAAGVVLTPVALETLKLD